MENVTLSEAFKKCGIRQTVVQLATLTDKLHVVYVCHSANVHFLIHNMKLTAISSYHVNDIDIGLT